MRSKIGIAIGAVALAIFVGRANFASSSAWAQESDDQAIAAASQNDDAAQPASGEDADSPEAAKFPIVGGVYSGTVMDANQGAGTISAAVGQTKGTGKIFGTWQDTFILPAFLNGTVKANGNMNLRMRFYIKGNCGYLFTGVFKNGDEIAGSHKLNSCGKKFPADHGTFDMTKQ